MLLKLLLQAKTAFDLSMFALLLAVVSTEHQPHCTMQLMWLAAVLVDMLFQLCVRSFIPL